jgi:hypothetical protein
MGGELTGREPGIPNDELVTSRNVVPGRDAAHGVLPLPERMFHLFGEAGEFRDRPAGVESAPVGVEVDVAVVGRYTPAGAQRPLRTPAPRIGLRVVPWLRSSRRASAVRACFSYSAMLTAWSVGIIMDSSAELAHARINCQNRASSAANCHNPRRPIRSRLPC